MKIVFIGASSFGLKCLSEITNMRDIEIAGVVTNAETFSISYNKQGVTNVLYSDFSVFASEKKIPFYKMVKNMQEQPLHEFINTIKPDLIIVVGWYHLIPESILDNYLCVGMHASLLPDYSGGAPLVWAIINGEKKTGITLFKFDKGVDSGDIIGQLSVTIEEEDTIKTLYDKIENLGIKLLENFLPKIKNKTVEYIKQDETRRKVYPQRKPEDGLIDLTKTAIELYNFIRAQSSPYPGAFLKTVDGKKLIIEKVRIQD